MRRVSSRLHDEFRMADCSIKSVYWPFSKQAPIHENSPDPVFTAARRVGERGTKYLWCPAWWKTSVHVQTQTHWATATNRERAISCARGAVQFLHFCVSVSHSNVRTTSLHTTRHQCCSINAWKGSSGSPFSLYSAIPCREALFHP